MAPGWRRGRDRVDAGTRIALQPLQFAGHVGGALIAQRTVRFEHPAQNFPEFWGMAPNNRRGERPDSGWASQLSGGDFKQDNPERIEIATSVQLVSANLFRRHVGECAGS